MSGQDRDKWNDRYRAGAYAERPHPAALVERWAPDLLEQWLRRSVEAESRALDLACGAGRNAIWLAERGFAVDAVDIAEAGLELARRRAAERGVTVGWHCLDLDEGLPVELDGYDLVLAMRFLDRQVFPQLPGRLRPGGWLVSEISPLLKGEVIAQVAQHPELQDAAIRDDLARLPRVLSVRRRP